MKRILTAIPLVLIPTLALAHPGHGVGLAAGLIHPFTGLDHMLAMTGVGLWAAAIGGRARWALPAAFLGFMALGGAFGMAEGIGPMLAAVQPMIVASVILLSALVALAGRAPMAVALPLVAMFGAAHGAAHGLEGHGLGFALGMLAATAALHGAGLALGLTVGPRTRRTMGGLGVVAGLALAVAG